MFIGALLCPWGLLLVHWIMSWIRRGFRMGQQRAGDLSKSEMSGSTPHGASGSPGYGGPGRLASSSRALRRAPRWRIAPAHSCFGFGWGDGGALANHQWSGAVRKTAPKAGVRQKGSNLPPNEWTPSVATATQPVRGPARTAVSTYTLFGVHPRLMQRCRNLG